MTDEWLDNVVYVHKGILFSCNLKGRGLGVVVHAYNPSYLGSGDCGGRILVPSQSR
jgi:hypothetical protein